MTDDIEDFDQMFPPSDGNGCLGVMWAIGVLFLLFLAGVGGIMLYEWLQ